MAQGQGSYKAIPNGQDTFGGHLFGMLDYSGPASYVQGGDGPISPQAFGMFNTILALFGSVDQSNAYFVIGRPLTERHNRMAVGLVQQGRRRGWAGATNLSGVTVKLSAIGY